MLKSLKKAAAVAALGVGMLAVVATAPASAANVKTFNLNGTFDSTAVKDFQNNGPLGLPVNLQGGSFDGTYSVDVDQLPTSGSNVGLNSWFVNLRNSSNAILQTLASNVPNPISYILNDQLVIADNSGYTSAPGNVIGLILQFNPNFTGTGTGVGTFTDHSITTGLQSAGDLSVNTASSQPVPEPLTMTATAVAAGMGLWMKRKQKASQSA
jgi:hypothetical protein